MEVSVVDDGGEGVEGDLWRGGLGMRWAGGCRSVGGKIVWSTESV